MASLLNSPVRRAGLLAAAALLAATALAAPASALDTAAKVALAQPEEERCQDPRLQPQVTCHVCIEVLEGIELHLPPDGDGPRFRCQDTKPPEGSA